MNKSLEETNKELVLKVFDLLFNKRDFAAAEQFFSPNYIQHNAYVPSGREGLFKDRPTSRYENQSTVANDDHVMLQGRFSERCPGQPNLITADNLRLEEGLIVEHWDVIQNEVSRENSNSGLPMFGEKFPGE